MSDQPKCLPDRVVRGGAGRGGSEGCAGEFLFHRDMAGDRVAHDARHSSGRTTRLFFVIKPKVMRVFGADTAQTGAGNDASSRAQFIIPSQRRICDGVASGDDAKLGEAVEPVQLRFSEMPGRFKPPDLGRIMKAKPRRVDLSNGPDARTTGTQGFFELRERIADTREHAHAGNNYAAHR